MLIRSLGTNEFSNHTAGFCKNGSQARWLQPPLRVMPVERTGRATVRSSTASAFIRTFREDVVAEWQRAARQLPIARGMTPATLLDHVPELLDEIADIADEFTSAPCPAPVFETARRHALDRLSDGFDVAMIVRELSFLRDAIFNVWTRNMRGREMADLRALNLALDRAIAVSVARYAEVHERTLAGIDRISTASFESSDVDDLMRRLLTVFIKTTPAVDTAAIFLIEGDRLRLRAAAGLEAELDPDVSVALGEGFLAIKFRFPVIRPWSVGSQPRSRSASGWRRS